jgi:multidrug resistance efflux pump
MPTGSWVKQGTLLFKIDPAAYEAALNKLRVEIRRSPARKGRPLLSSTDLYGGKDWRRD